MDACPRSLLSSLPGTPTMTLYPMRKSAAWAVVSRMRWTPLSLTAAAYCRFCELCPSMVPELPLTAYFSQIMASCHLSRLPAAPAYWLPRLRHSATLSLWEL